MNDHKITVYSTATCHYCVLLKNFLDEKGVKYESVDVGLDRSKAMEMIEKSGQMGVPVIEIDGKITVGYQPEVISKQLGF